MNEHPESIELSAYLDLEVPVERRPALSSHLTHCAECRQELESFAGLRQRLAAVGRRKMPEALAARLTARFSRRPLFGRSGLASWLTPRVWIPGALAAAAGAAILAVHLNRPLELPLEPLLASHSRYQTESLTAQRDVAASNFSYQLARYEADVE